MSANESKAKIRVNNPDVTRLLDRLVKKGMLHEIRARKVEEKLISIGLNSM